METWTAVWPWNKPDERLQVTSVKQWWPGRAITQYFNSTPNLKLKQATFLSASLQVLPWGITVGTAVAKIVLAAWLPLMDPNLTYAAVPPNLAGIHRFLNAGQPVKSRLLTPFPLDCERKPICNLYPRSHVVHQECTGNSSNKWENNNWPVVKEVSVKLWIHYCECHNPRNMTRFTVILWAIRSNSSWKEPHS